MIVHFANRKIEILGTATTDLPYGIAIIDDMKTEELDTGLKTFECTLAYDDSSRKLVVDNVAVGNFLLRSQDNEDEFYTIIQTEHDTETQTVHVYCEDAGLDLINTIVPAFENTESHNLEWYVNKWLPAGWVIGINELSESTLTESWDGESTVTERLRSIATKFGGEMDFSYETNHVTITKRKVNFYKHKGLETAQYQLRLNGDISKIVTNKTIENLATAFKCSGSTPEGKDTPITFVGCDYSSDGTATHEPAVAGDDYQIVDDQVRCISAMAKWRSSLDADGLLVREYTYETDNKKELFSHAVAELKKVKDEEITYNIEFISFPKAAKLGDRINVVNDKDELYMEGRILRMQKSVIQDTVTAELGDYIYKTSGISDKLQALADKLRAKSISATKIDISSSGGTQFHNTAISTTLTATVRFGDQVITNQVDLERIFGDTATIKWYNSGVAVGTGFTYSVSSANAKEIYTARVEA